MQMPTASEADAPAVLRVVPLFGGEAATAMLSFGQSYARYAVGTSAGSVCLEDTSHCFYPGSQINALQVSADGLEIYSGSSNGRICRMFVADMTVGGSCYSQPGNIPTNNVLSLVLQGRDRIASSSTNGILAVWNLNLTVFTNQEPLLVFHTSNNHMRMVISRDQTYYYTSGTAGEIQAYSVDSRPTAVRRMKQSRICQAGKCTTDSVQYHSHDEVAMPPCLQTLPLRSLSLQGARIDGMGPRPPYSLRRVNLSGSSLADWRSMRSGWWSIPSVIDVTHTGGYVTIPILHGEAMRLVTDSNCKKTAAVKEHDLSFCILRSYQTEGQLCAENFNSHDMTREALAANVEGTPLPILTRILVDPEYFQAWLCDCPSGRHGHNGSHCVECPVNFFCPSAGRGNVALNFDPLPCPPNSGTTKTGSKNISDCVCLPGFYDSGIGGPKACQQCPAGTAANNYGQTECQECNFGYRTYSSSDQRSSLCYPDLYGLAFVGVLQLAMIQLVWICWRHFGGLLINDVSQQNGRWIVSACGRRILWIFPWLPNIYHVRFSRTGNPGLDHPQEPIRAIAIPGIGQRFAILEPGENPQSNREFNRGGYLRRSTTNLLEEGEVCSFSSLDTSKGRLYIQCPAVLISGRLIPSGVAFLLLSFLAWPLLMQARERRTWLLAGLGFTSVIATIVIAIASLSAPRPAIQANLSNFRSLLPKPQKVPRGAARALEVESISNLLVQFQFFIGNRNMYYVSTNILLPITEPLALSFAEMVGPKQTKYFVSHYWGTPFEHAMHSVVKHAQLAEGRRWKHAPYWICSFSNNQWDIEEELGSGDLAQSSFYLALTDPRTCATVMLLDEEAKALSRAWCLFEVLQTCLLSQRIPTFQGLLLCTPSGVLNKDDGQSGGSVSIDTAIAVAQTLKNLRLEEAAATNPADKEMIDALVERYPGKHEAMNRFVRAQIRNALRLIKEKHNETFVKLLMELERSETGPLGQTAFAGGIPSMQWKPGTTPDIDAASASAPSVRRSPWGWGSMGASASVAEESSGDSDSEESDSDGETMATALTASRSF
ncbi:unnamed protein product [Cladocopium goreaui]|uniref:Modification methylase SPRI n=1 Tax=Cladocopium goreaui TaxID=2562237 RepID=A0A9P1C7W4_9DINO|nr:unnamed protein product [Cladocopium goreaui]